MGVSQRQEERSTLEEDRALTMAEYSPTIEEFVYSFMPTRTIPTNLEGMTYFNVKAAMALGGIYARTFYIMATTGKSFVDAGYIATNTWTSYKWMSTLRAIPSVARGSVRALPMVAAPLALTWGAHQVIRDPVFQKTGTPKLGLPLPLWLQYASGSTVQNQRWSHAWVTPGGHFHVGYSFNPEWI